MEYHITYSKKLFKIIKILENPQFFESKRDWQFPKHFSKKKEFKLLQKNHNPDCSSSAVILWILPPIPKLSYGS
jgi:hypothetical protein